MHARGLEDHGRRADIKRDMAEQKRPDPGEAGRSARRESERKRERRLQSKPPKSGLAKLIAVLFGPSTKEKRQLAEEKHWATGADGEQLLATSLAGCAPGFQSCTTDGCRTAKRTSIISP